ncbi:MAG: protein translocase subunit SecF, partial [Candidatus Micrarchaeia archaeon]
VFRTFSPSLAVLTGAASDIVIALGAMGAFGIPLTLPSFAALLMLIGFSLDTDILLTMRTLKRTEGTPRQRAYETMKTGATMSLAALVAFGALLALALVTHIPTYYQIASVAIAGLLGDLVATWGLNAVVILWYLERKGM